MRISDAMIQRFAATASQGLKEAIYRSAEKIASGQVISTPSEDPVIAAKMVRMDRLIKQLNTIERNHLRVRGDLVTAEQGLSHTSGSLAEVKSLAIAMANDTVTDLDRDATAKTVQGYLDQMLNTANRQQEDGRHLYSGIAEATQPYVPVGGFPTTTISYAGSTKSRRVEVAPGVLLDATVTAEQSFGPNGEVFQAVADLITALDSDDILGIQNALDVLDDEMGRVVVNLASVGTRIQGLDETNAITEDLKIQYMLQKADIIEVDMTIEVTNFKTAETTLQAVVEVTRRMLANSVASFLR